MSPDFPPLCDVSVDIRLVSQQIRWKSQEDIFAISMNSILKKKFGHYGWLWSCRRWYDRLVILGDDLKKTPRAPTSTKSKLFSKKFFIFSALRFSFFFSSSESINVTSPDGRQMGWAGIIRQTNTYCVQATPWKGWIPIRYNTNTYTNTTDNTN